MSDFSDAALIARVLVNDDRNAFGELVRRYQSDVRALLRRLSGGDDATADDLAQDTFIRAYRHLATYKGDAKLSTWLYRIAYNLFLSMVERRREMESFDEVAAEEGHYEESSYDRILSSLDIQKGMVRLNEQERTAVHLNYAKDMTHEEIAQVLSCPLGTVKTNIARAKAKMRKILYEQSAAEALS